MFSNSFFCILIVLLVISIFLSFLTNRNVETFEIKLFSKIKDKVKDKTGSLKQKIKDKKDSLQQKIKDKKDALKQKVDDKKDALKQKIDDKKDALQKKTNKVSPVDIDRMNNPNFDRISNLEKPKNISMSMDNNTNNNCSCSCSIQDEKLDYIIKCSCDCGSDSIETPKPTMLSTNDVIAQNKNLTKEMQSQKPPPTGSDSLLFYNNMKSSSKDRASTASGQKKIDPNRSNTPLNIGEKVKVMLKGDSNIHSGVVEKKQYHYQLKNDQSLKTFNNAESNGINFTSTPQKTLVIDDNYVPLLVDNFYTSRKDITETTSCSPGKIFLKACGNTDNLTNPNLNIGDYMCVCDENGNQQEAQIVGISYSAQNVTVSDKQNLTNAAFSSFDFDSDNNKNVTSIITKA